MQFAGYVESLTLTLQDSTGLHLKAAIRQLLGDKSERPEAEWSKLLAAKVLERLVEKDGTERDLATVVLSTICPASPETQPFIEKQLEDLFPGQPSTLIGASERIPEPLTFALLWEAKHRLGHHVFSKVFSIGLVESDGKFQDEFRRWELDNRLSDLKGTPQPDLIVEDNEVALSEIAEFDSVRQLWLDRCDVPAVAELERIRGLRSLILRGCRLGFTDFTPMGRIEALGIENCEMPQSPQITVPDGLKTVNVTAERVTLTGNLSCVISLSVHGNVEVEGNLNSLRRLNWVTDELTSLPSGLKLADSLKDLDVSGEKLVDISSLVPTCGLERASCFALKLQSVSALAHHKNLQKLAISSDELTDIGPLRKLKNLWDLSIQGSNLESIEAVGNLEALERFNLSSCREIQLSSLAKLQNLWSISLTGCLIRDLNALTGLPLKLLRLSMSQQEDFKSLPKLKQLISLGLGQTNFSNLSLLSEMTQLEELDLTDTRLRSLEGLPPFGRLKRIRVGGPNLESLLGIESALSLTSLVVAGARQLDLSPLTSLPNLRSLHLLDSDGIDVFQLETHFQVRLRKLPPNRDGEIHYELIPLGHHHLSH